MRHRVKQLSLVLFLDFFTYAGLIPLIPLLVLPTKLSLVSSEIGLQERYLILGLLLATYPFAQMIASPLLGFFSDRFGKKKFLMLSYIGNAIGYLLTILALVYGKIELVFLGHFLAGILACNLSVIQALIGSIPTQKNIKHGFFSLNQIALGLAFLLGPLASGMFLSWLNWSAEGAIFLLLLCTATCGVNLFLVTRIFRNSSSDSLEGYPAYQFNISFRSATKLHYPAHYQLLSGLLYFLSWYGFFKLFQAFLLTETSISVTGVFSILSFYGFCFLLAQVFFYFFSQKRELSIGGILALYAAVGIGITLCLTNKSLITIYCGATLFSFAHAMLTTVFVTRIAGYSGHGLHGTIMGFYQASQSFAKVLGPILFSLVMAFSITASILVSIGLLGISAGLFLFCERR